MDVGPPPERPPDPEVTPHKCGAGMWGRDVGRDVGWRGGGWGGGPSLRPTSAVPLPHSGILGGGGWEGGHLWGTPHLWGTETYLGGAPHLLVGHQDLLMGQPISTYGALRAT